MKFRQWVSLGVVGAALAAGGWILTGGPQPAMAEKSSDSAMTQTAPVLDRALGKEDAPVTIIEYASLTCSHCADFHAEAFEKIKENYIDTGKVKLIYRAFPFDGIGLKAAAIAQCMPKDRFFPFIGLLYKNQMQWALSPKPEDAVIQYAKLGGLSEADARTCLDDTKLLDALAASRIEGQNKYNVHATPSFVFNDGTAMLQGAQPYEQFAQLIDELLAGK